MPNLEALPAFDDRDDAVHVVIETSKGARNKLKFEPQFETFVLSKVLPASSIFPFDFGFVPSTRAEDGDPLDVLVLLDEPTPAGSVVRVRLIGVIRAEQSEDRHRVRNDRLVGVSIASPTYGAVTELQELPGTLVDQIEHFFTAYNAFEQREFRIVGREGAAAAKRACKAALVHAAAARRA